MKIINLIIILMMIIIICSCITYGTTIASASGADLKKEVSITWGAGRGQMISTAGNSDLIIRLSMDKASGSGFQSNNQYLFGKLDMQIKLVQGNSAGTVTAYYLSSQGLNHDEIDFEFLGNSSGEPYTLHTNVFTQGKGNREQQFFMWFDPTTDFHTYTILWNTQQILFLVDGTSIRVFHNAESRGVPYPKDQPMRLYASLWDAEAWATRGGLVKTDWSKAPFTASFRNFAVDACVVNGGKSSCNGSPTKAAWWAQSMGTNDRAKLEWVRKNYMVYDYCQDRKRFPQGFPLECSISP